jgi:S1-C subfamily serine protease
MKFLRTFFLIIPILFSANITGADKIPKAVVKIFVTTNTMDYYRPWQSKGSSISGGSGAIIIGNKILTNAHVVSDATFIQVKKHNDSKKFTARLVAIGHDCDLALLEVNDKDFFDGVVPLDFGDLPNLQDTVTVLGYPQGGDKLSITEGVVSRIELTSYSQSARKLLAVQIDAAINPGNSGGPVIKNGKIIGVAMQRLQSGQNIGYMIPVPIIWHFFEDFEDGNYDGFPMLGVDYNNTDNSALRKSYAIKAKQGGVIVTNTLPFSSSENVLIEGDVILKVDDIKIGQDGTFKFRSNERLAMPYLITKKQVGDLIKLKIIRNSQEKDIEVELKSFISLVPHPHHFKNPPYYIHGGLVFTVLSADLLKSWGNNWFQKAPNDLLYYLLGKGRMNKERVLNKVVLLRVLADDINIGYHNYGPEIVETVNGFRVDSFDDFVSKIINAKSSEYTVIDTTNNAHIILSNKGIDNINKEILIRNAIPHQNSTNLNELIDKY